MARVIVFDTNVVSELAKPRPDSGAMSWVNRQLDPAITAPTLAELRFGVARLPRGRRRRALSETIDRLVTEAVGGMVLAFDAAAANAYGAIVARRERTGRPIGIFDAQIAAICLVHKATLATRNVADFSDTGIEVVDPWNP